MGELDLSKYKKNANGRIDFSKTFSSVPLPNLCDVQLDSFRWFVNQGVDDVFRDIFPVYSNKDQRAHLYDTDQIAELDFDSASWGEPKHDYFECKVSNLTYCAPLHVKMRLKHPDGTVVQETIFMGDFPWMTPSGTFIVNGSEKCIASQLIRSPGAYVSCKIGDVSLSKLPEKSEKGDSESDIQNIYGSDIIPARGIWLEYLTDNRDFLSVRIDKQKKVPAVTLLRALGLVSDSTELEDTTSYPSVSGTQRIVTGIRGLFGNSKQLVKALSKNPVKMNEDLSRSLMKPSVIFS